MVKSMTGYGRCRKTIGNRDITVEVKSVNNRYLDCSVKLPRSYIFAEDAIKSYIQEHVSRGKVDVFVSIDIVSGDDDVIVSVNEALAMEYSKALKKLDETMHWDTHISSLDLARFPDVLVVTKKDEDLQAISDAIVEVLSDAVASYDDMRKAEGAKLAEDLINKGKVLLDYVSKVEERSPETLKEYRERLDTKMREVLSSTDIDETRIVQEVALYADKIAVDEETVRLRSHISQLNTMLKSDVAIGRKLDFLVQEMNRECNTIGSKCNDITVTSFVVNMKSEVEKIREQVQNIE